MPSVKFIEPDGFRRAARSGETRGLGVVRQSAYALRAGNDPATRIRRWRFSDGSLDRLNDRISPTGWDTAAFMRAGGPVLFAHDALSPPIGGTRTLSSNGIALTGDIEFAGAATYEFADTVLKLIDFGALKAGSVGFLPRKWAWSSVPGREGGIDFIEQELLEFSICAVPALPSALQEARSVGIDTRPVVRWAERALDRGSSTMPRADLMRLRELAQEPPRTSSVVSLGGRRIARDLVRAAQIKRRVARNGPMPVHQHVGPSVDERERAEAERLADRRAAIDRVARMVSWWFQVAACDLPRCAGVARAVRFGAQACTRAPRSPPK